MHLAADGGAEDPVVFVTKLFHRIPGRVRVDIVDAAKVGDGARRSRDQLQPWRRTVLAHIFDDLDEADEQENAGANEPFVGPNGIDGRLRLEKSVRGLIGMEVVRDLGHNDRRLDGGRHARARMCIDCVWEGSSGPNEGKGGGILINILLGITTQKRS